MDSCRYFALLRRRRDEIGTESRASGSNLVTTSQLPFPKQRLAGGGIASEHGRPRTVNEQM